MRHMHLSCYKLQGVRLVQYNKPFAFKTLSIFIKENSWLANWTSHALNFALHPVNISHYALK